MSPSWKRYRRAQVTGRFSTISSALPEPGGNLTSDAHIAAMAIESGASVYSADYDFRRFPGLLHVNPLDDAG